MYIFNHINKYIYIYIYTGKNVNAHTCVLLPHMHVHIPFSLYVYARVCMKMRMKSYATHHFRGTQPRALAADSSAAERPRGGDGGKGGQGAVAAHECGAPESLWRAAQQYGPCSVDAAVVAVRLASSRDALL